MPIPTKTSISGFVRFDPELTYTKDGAPRLYMPVGVKQSVQDAEGQWHDVEPYRTGLVMFGASAERAHEQFKAGDNFISEGWVRDYVSPTDGQQREEFRASRIGHDNNLTTYTVDRTPSERDTAARHAPERDATQQDTPAAETAAETPGEVPGEVPGEAAAQVPALSLIHI